MQRVPPTEKKGRVHTSTVTVAVLEEKTINYSIRDADLKIEWFSGTGAGGQHRNKHQNSCRITHVPSGVVASAQSRSRTNSLKMARDDIVKRLSTQLEKDQQQEISGLRRDQRGSGMRGDKRRTYRFQEDIVLDHITGKRASIKKIMAGGLELLW